MFTRDDARWLSECARTLYRARSAVELVRSALDVVGRRWNPVVNCCEELTPDASFYIAHEMRVHTTLPRDYAACIHDNPLCEILQSGRVPPVMHLTGRFSRKAWEGTAHYNCVARPAGFADQMVAVLQAEPTFVALSLFPEKAFAESEAVLLGLLQPHLQAAWQRVRRPSMSREWTPLQITLSPELRPHFLSVTQRAVLRSYFPRWREVGRLPVELQAWVAHTLRQLQQEPPPHPLRAFAIESARGRLLARCFPGANGDPMQLFLVETPAQPDFLQLRARGLTSRECEVLHWLAQGKRDAEIAVILGCAAATVSKHVEHVLRKLRAENRAAAVPAARRWL